MSRLRRPGLCLLAAAVLVGGACTPDAPPEIRQSPGERLSADPEGYEKASAPRELAFPADHGPHPRHKHEWWYLTGQATTAGGRRFGYQFTIFREAVSPRPPDNPSRWATSQLYLAHAAVSDIDGEKYLSDERFARGALELAGASAAPFRIWLETWQMRGAADRDRLDGRVSADSERFAFDLEIRSTRPPVAHGARGLSAKGPAGNASYYYSYTGLKTRGEISVDGESFQVTGSSWFDHEWSSSALAEDQAGWDWLSLQLAGDRALMVFRLRHRTDPERDFYSGTFVDGSGDVATLSNGQIRLQPLDHWTSEATGARYPVRWRLEIPHLDLSLTTEPRLLDQEFVHGFRYWEGAVAASGRLAGERIDGQGYVELTGYGAATD